MAHGLCRCGEVNAKTTCPVGTEQAVETCGVVRTGLAEPLRLWIHAILLLFFFLDDDPWCHSHHECARFPANRRVLEQAIDIRNLAQDGNATFEATFPHPLDATQENRTTVWNADGCRNAGVGKTRLLNRGTGDDVFAIFVFIIHRPVWIQDVCSRPCATGASRP